MVFYNFSKVFFNCSMVFFDCSMVFFNFSMVFFNLSMFFFNLCMVFIQFSLVFIDCSRVFIDFYMVFIDFPEVFIYFSKWIISCRKGPFSRKEKVVYGNSLRWWMNQLVAGGPLPLRPPSKNVWILHLCPNWLVVYLLLWKYESQSGLLFPIYIYGKIKNVPNHQPDKVDGQQTDTHGTIQHDVGTKTALRHVSCLAYSRCDLQAPVQFPNKKTCLEYYLPLR